MTIIDQLAIPLSPRTPSALLSSLILSPRPNYGFSLTPKQNHTQNQDENQGFMGRASSMGIQIPQSIFSILSPILPSTTFPSNHYQTQSGSGSTEDANANNETIKTPPLPGPVYRALRKKETRQIANLLIYNFETTNKIKNTSVRAKEMMRISIELSKLLDECEIRWDRQRRVMGIHLRGLWEMHSHGDQVNGGKGKNNKGKGKNKGVDMSEEVSILSIYVQKSFITTAKEPHPLDLTPLNLPTPPSQNDQSLPTLIGKPKTTQHKFPKHTIQAGLMTTLPVHVNAPSGSSASNTSHGDKLSINSIKSILTRSTSNEISLSPAPKTNSKVAVAPPPEKSMLTFKPSNQIGLKSILNNSNNNLSTMLYPPPQPSGLGPAKPNAELGLGVPSKLSESQKRDQRWGERKKSVGLRINVDNHMSNSTDSLPSGLPIRTAQTPISKSILKSAYTGTSLCTGYTAFTPKTSNTVRFKHLTKNGNGNGTPRPRFRQRRNGTPAPFTPAARHGRVTPKMEVAHQTGKYQTNLIQPFSAITAPIPPTPTPSASTSAGFGNLYSASLLGVPYSAALRSAHSITYPYSNKKPRFGFGFGFGLLLDLRFGEKRFTFRGGGTSSRIKAKGKAKGKGRGKGKGKGRGGRPKSGKRLGFDGWELR